MNDPLNIDQLISGALGESQISDVSNNEESTEITVEKIDTLSKSGDFTSTIKFSSTSEIRKARSLFATNISDARYAGIIELAIGSMQSGTFPPTKKITEMSGTEMAEMIALHMECARYIQGIFYDHVRNAVTSGTDPKSTREEIEALKKEARKKRDQQLAHEGHVSKKKAEKRAKEKIEEKAPLFERLLKSSDSAQRNAGKFIKQQMNIGLPEVAALKNWNDICAMSNNAAGMVKNINGKRLDEVLLEDKKK